MGFSLLCEAVKSSLDVHRRSERSVEKVIVVLVVLVVLCVVLGILGYLRGKVFWISGGTLGAVLGCAIRTLGVVGRNSTDVIKETGGALGNVKRQDDIAPDIRWKKAEERGVQDRLKKKGGR